MDRIFVRLGAVAGFLGVAMGAIAEHELRAQLTPDRLGIFETAARYHLLHAIALVLVGVIVGRRPSRLAVVSGWCFAGGIVLFSGSLYLFAVTGTTAFGMITPFGGLLFLAGWACLALSAV